MSTLFLYLISDEMLLGALISLYGSIRFSQLAAFVTRHLSSCHPSNELKHQPNVMVGIDDN